MGFYNITFIIFSEMNKSDPFYKRIVILISFLNGLVNYYKTTDAG